MWPLAGALLVVGGLLPSVLFWLREGVTAHGQLWRAAAAYCAIDAWFALCSVCFLWVAVQYGYTRAAAAGGSRSSSGKGRQHGPAPYPGAWVEADGRQAYPRGFPGYLGFAFCVSVVAPLLVLAACLLSGSSSSSTRALGAATLGPYFIVFLPQMMLETRLLNRSFMTPVLPVLYAYYRFWQFIRSLALLDAAATGRGGGGGGNGAQQDREAGWLLWYTLSLLAFWVFDTGCTMAWLPGMFEWQLQDPQLLGRLSALRAAAKREGGGGTRRQPGAAAAAPAAAWEGGPVDSSPAAAAKARHRRHVEVHAQGAFGSGEMDAYGFGT